ncbi:dihydrolipoamide dehydrogenase LpdG [Methyloglobulus morosus KoM1]|uniref:Dihydrolipoyl dehydrogenase n=1 Tax=Methyloglobulus morosus KoM1 TaxID=1116472 RepID=V5C5N1_9GAMM|nr:FAD-dependent oxidoreductase [Methyloglobulus morosus]ESS72028.1 dihydrolipoamide dehydrogenase LpdG [Methyloglobulus morosus KoM1]
MIKLKNKYDVIVIGSGPSGCACAIRSAQLGLKTLCIDNLSLGNSKKAASGIFTNAGCLATVTLLESAKLYESVVNNINSHGINVENVSFDARKMVQRKETILNLINLQTAKQFNDYKIDFINASAKLLKPHVVEIISPTPKTITSEAIVLATESNPISIPCAVVDNEFILDATAALNLIEVPKRLAILGAGVAGLELAGIWNRLGAETILLDAQETFLSLADHQISREAYKIFTEQGLELRLGTRVISTKIINKKVLVEYQDSEGSHAIRVDKLIVASGRKPNSDNIAAPEANLLLDENGYVHVNEKYRTNLPNVYAIGDLTLLGPMLAHKGLAEGYFVAEQIAGIKSLPINYGAMPNIIYTEPEIAWVGQTEQSIKSIGDPVKIGLFPLTMNPKAVSRNKSKGIIKIISCVETDVILGVHIIASDASELIAEATLAMEFSANNEDIIRTIHSYPSFIEAIRDACRSIEKLKTV